MLACFSRPFEGVPFSCLPLHPSCWEARFCGTYWSFWMTRPSADQLNSVQVHQHIDGAATFRVLFIDIRNFNSEAMALITWLRCNVASWMLFQPGVQSRITSGFRLGQVLGHSSFPVSAVVHWINIVAQIHMSQTMSRWANNPLYNYIYTYDSH